MNQRPGPLLTLLLLITLSMGTAAQAAINHYVYVFPPGHVTVYDIDNNFAQVKDIAIPQTQTLAANELRGAVGSAATGMMYLSYSPTACSTGEMLKYDLVRDTVAWIQTYPFGIDNHSISPDGKTLYSPTGDGCSSGLWHILDALTGNPLGTINSGGSGPHDTIMSLSGAHLYMGPAQSSYLVVADTSNGTIIQNIGPVSPSSVRPFTINSEGTLAFITTLNKVGFYVGNINTGKILYWVCPPGYCSTGTFNGTGTISHGISLSPDERELYLLDYPNNRVHVFDVTGLPASAPADVADIPLKCTMTDEGWIEHSRDGRYVFVGDCGDVIDTSQRQITANMPVMLHTRLFNEVDFLNGVVSFTPLSRNQGGYLSQMSSSPCDVNRDGVVNVVDVQLEVNMALGISPCTNPSGTCTVVSVQRVVNAALGGQCVSP
jgi:DNA-binding beta-propeller fold protein YncE